MSQLKVGVSIFIIFHFDLFGNTRVFLIFIKDNFTHSVLCFIF